jgi:hypothetical protein
MQTFTLESFAAETMRIVGLMESVQHAALERAAQLIEFEAKRVIGTHDYNWPPLTDATIGCEA